MGTLNFNDALGKPISFLIDGVKTFQKMRERPAAIKISKYKLWDEGKGDLVEAEFGKFIKQNADILKEGMKFNAGGDIHIITAISGDPEKPTVWFESIPEKYVGTPEEKNIETDDWSYDASYVKPEKVKVKEPEKVKEKIASEASLQKEFKEIESIASGYGFDMDEHEKGTGSYKAMFSSREEGSVGDETASQSLINQGRELAQKIKSGYPHAKVWSDIVDEWVLVSVDSKGKEK